MITGRVFGTGEQERSVSRDDHLALEGISRQRCQGNFGNTIRSLGVGNPNGSIQQVHFHRGVVTPPKERELSFPGFVFFKMCGPASHLFLGGCQFETEMNIFRTDFTSILKQFPLLRSSDEQIGRTLVACRMFLEKYCRELVEIQKEPIFRLGAALQAAAVGPRRYELKEAGLQAALVAAGVAAPIYR